MDHVTFRGAYTNGSGTCVVIASGSVVVETISRPSQDHHKTRHKTMLHVQDQSRDQSRDQSQKSKHMVCFSRSANRKLYVVLTAICAVVVALFLLVNGKLFESIVRPNEIRMSHKWIAIRDRQFNSTARAQVTNKFDVMETSTSQTVKSDSMAQQASVQSNRKRALRDVCRRHPELTARSVWKHTLTNLLVMEKNRILYCTVPKVGCSNWKRLFLFLEGHRSSLNMTQVEVHFNNPLRTLWNMPGAGRRHAMKSYRKFMYVRHPFVRLVSAYRNKLAGSRPFRQGPNLEFIAIARKIVREYRKGARPTDLTKDNLDVKWEEWIAYLTDPSNREGFDVHWREVYKLCSPCSVRYDFIGHLETVEADSRYMFKLFGLSNASYPSSSRPKVSSTDVYDQYFANVSRKDLQRLWEIYKLDFELFGYAKPERLID